MKLRTTTGILLATAASMALAAPAFAQAAQGAAETADTNEIDVTAQNRSQNVQDVPIAISVVTGKALADKGVTDFTSVQKVAPVLNITNDTNNTHNYNTMSYNRDPQNDQPVEPELLN